MVPENKKNFMKLIAAGQIFYIIAVVFMGPFPGIPNEIKYICIGTMIAGFGGAFTNNFAVPAMD